MRYQPIAATALSLVLVGAGAVSASAVDWDGGGAGDLDWSNTANWNPDGVPAASSALVFSTGGVESNFDLGNGYLVSGITLNNASGFTVHHQNAGEGIALTGDLNTLTASGAVYFLDVPINVTPATSNWNVGGTDQLNITEPVTLNAGTTANFTTQTNAFLGFNDALNGGNATKDGGGFLTLLGGGTIGGMTINNGVVHTSSVTPNMNVVNIGGYLTGSSVNPLCANQLVGSVDLQGGYIGPGDADFFGGGIGRMCLSGGFLGNDNSTYLADVEGATADLIHSTGTFSPNGSYLELTTGTAPAKGTPLTIAESTDILPGFFRDQNGDPIADNAVFETADGQFYRMDYRTTTIVLTYLGDTAPVDPPAPALAATGVDAGTVTLLAGFLVLAGAGAIFVATRRREV